ncbi:zinc-ribbon-domain-containing protein [Podospora appendiculata]|uniref:Zinc-ribbon-domain-containing protein n=1 Tax=Podospora appendiculata TaxID=314037 RepID=A0AAE0WYP2_9PEZI|nr:zinc-ribbon-domain-containing protein [Podospora appendiculata]KAK3684270.1 zinc-ribbon-domain-containing protein [Podospora appendiculata]
MPSLVNELIIGPVVRQARRFSSGFASAEPPLLPELHRQRTASGSQNRPGSSIENAIAEEEGDGNGAGAGAGAVTRTGIRARTASHVDNNNPSTSTSTLDVRSRATTQPSQPPQPPPHTASAAPRPRLVDSPESIRAPTPLWSGDPDDTIEYTEGLPMTWPRISESTLPEDDGKGALRRRIQAILSQDISQDIKARLVHQAITEGHNKFQLAAAPDPTLWKPESPSAHSAPEPTEPVGPLQYVWNQLSDGAAPPALSLIEGELTKEDLTPTYVPAASASLDTGTDDFEESLRKKRDEQDSGDSSKPRLGCAHYRRNVKMQCAACAKWYTCRFCHDAAEDHALPRKATKNMLCMLCGCAQRASDSCVGCGRAAACYYCGVCKLWNDDPHKAIYHCNDCGLCRVGQGLGKDFFHCKKCMACISMTGAHKCIERSIDCDCPICGEYLFNSPKPVVFMQCGHSIHRHCFHAHMNSSYKCPLCNKSCVNMEYQFRNLDLAILNQPMPHEYRDARAVVSCNDCSAKSQTAFHWLGLKCSVCNSYNTVQLQLLHMPGEAEAETETGRGGEEEERISLFGHR